MIRKADEKLIWRANVEPSTWQLNDGRSSRPGMTAISSKLVKIVLMCSLVRIRSLSRDVFIERQRRSFVVMSGSRFLGSSRNLAITPCFEEGHAKHSCNG